MKVILLRDIAKLGKRGEIKEVADGFAINVLIRKGDAIMATQIELTKLKQAEDKKQREKDMAENSFLKLIDEIKRAKIEITVKKHDNGHLFAAIPASDIVDAIFTATKISVNPSQIEVKTPIKALGEHHLILRQGERNIQIALHVVGK